MANLYIKKGQSGLEYVALITVAVLVILSVVWGKLQPKLESAFTTVGDKIVYDIEKIK